VLGLRSQVLPRPLVGNACSYLLDHWDVLVAHQQHSFTRLDNNLVENAIRRKRRFECLLDEVSAVIAMRGLEIP
jgi:hypothetical protein